MTLHLRARHLLTIHGALMAALAHGALAKWSTWVAWALLDILEVELEAAGIAPPPDGWRLERHSAVAVAGPANAGSTRTTLPQAPAKEA